MRQLNFFVILLITSLGLACNSTKISSSWKAENTATKIYRNIMVWGILPQNDSTLRKKMETHLVNDLVSKGYHAVSSLEVYRLNAYKKLNAGEIVDEFKSTAVDAVITLVLLNKEKEEKYYAATILNQPAGNYGNLDRYYSTVYEKILTPGYYLSTTNYFWETNLFEVNRDKLIYVVKTKSFDPLSSEKLAHENGLRIIKDMLKKKIIVDKIPKEY
jgi:hypothetical protein